MNEEEENEMSSEAVEIVLTGQGWNSPDADGLHVGKKVLGYLVPGTTDAYQVRDDRGNVWWAARDSHNHPWGCEIADEEEQPEETKNGIVRIELTGEGWNKIEESRGLMTGLIVDARPPHSALEPTYAIKDALGFEWAVFPETPRYNPWKNWTGREVLEEEPASPVRGRVSIDEIYETVEDMKKRGASSYDLLKAIAITFEEEMK